MSKVKELLENILINATKNPIFCPVIKKSLDISENYDWNSLLEVTQSSITGEKVEEYNSPILMIGLEKSIKGSIYTLTATLGEDSSSTLSIKDISEKLNKYSPLFLILEEKGFYEESEFEIGNFGIRINYGYESKNKTEITNLLRFLINFQQTRIKKSE